ncbi:hypothetical protein P154DRAFT_526603 [Amniculicola lignicola CBS 123094]|uniref:Uncharacterized protein n=1 Tax=Amniculicola lignicola CBS 123094 TaxID=1392246 RepID=A0A6A5WBX5_9PLEO|nr:hypothetical protein P154DRAFT_526603 [Amniculicola lignicola CBS 123094]
MDANEAEADAGHQEIHVQEAQPPPLLGAPTGGLDNGRMAIANLINSVQGDQDHAARSGNSPRDEDVPTAAQNSGVITNHGLHASVSKPPRKRKRSASDPFEGFEEFWQLVERVEEADIELDEKELELDECNLKLKELHSQMMLELAKMSELRKQKAAAQDRRRAALADQEALLHRAHLSPMQLFELGRRVEENTKRSKDDSK